MSVLGAPNSGECDARPLTSPWTLAEVRPQKLADENGLARSGADRLKELSPGQPPLAGFGLIMNGRF